MNNYEFGVHIFCCCIFMFRHSHQNPTQIIRLPRWQEEKIQAVLDKSSLKGITKSQKKKKKVKEGCFTLGSHTYLCTTLCENRLYRVIISHLMPQGYTSSLSVNFIPDSTVRVIYHSIVLRSKCYC